MPPSLNTPTVHLHTSRLHLRPMTDADWDTLLRWNQDPDVLYYADGSDVTAYTLDQIKRHLRRHLASRLLLYRRTRRPAHRRGLVAGHESVAHYRGPSRQRLPPH